jgi:hypothetical protein
VREANLVHHGVSRLLGGPWSLHGSVDYINCNINVGQRNRRPGIYFCRHTYNFAHLHINRNKFEHPIQYECLFMYFRKHVGQWPLCFVTV